MSLDLINIIAKGYIRAYDEHGALIYEHHNDIQSFAAEAITKLLMGQMDYGIWGIQVFNDGISKGSFQLNNLDLGETNQIVITTLIPSDSSISDIDELRLLVGTSQVFSKATGLTLNKPEGESLVIIWTLTINI